VDLHGVVGGELREVRKEGLTRYLEGTHQVRDGFTGGLVDAFHELEDVVRVAVDDGDTDVCVVLVLRKIGALACACWGRQATHRIRVLVELRRARRKDVGRVELGVHRVGLACVDHEEDFIISAVSMS
jgi:hypothetical protein